MIEIILTLPNLSDPSEVSIVTNISDEDQVYTDNYVKFPRTIAMLGAAIAKTINAENLSQKGVEATLKIFIMSLVAETSKGKETSQ